MKNALLLFLFISAPSLILSLGNNWKWIEAMSTDERENAILEIILDGEDQSAKTLKNEIEVLWNDGEYEAALALFPKFEELVGENCYETTVRWKEPVPCTQHEWGSDVRISTRYTVYELVYDIDYNTSNLMAAIISRYSDYNILSVHVSTDGGLNWSETMASNTGDLERTVDAIFCDDHFYVVYNSGVNNKSPRLLRFKAADGQLDTFNDGSTFVIIYNSVHTVYELSIVSSIETGYPELFFSAIQNNSDIKLFRGISGGLTWYDVTPFPAITNVSNGLDMCYNTLGSGYTVILSYKDRSSLLMTHVYGRWYTGCWVEIAVYDNCGVYSSATAVGAWRDTIICVFEYYDSLRYIESFEGGTNWHWGKVYSNPAELHRRPDITCRQGGGQAVVYHFRGYTNELRYAHRNYGSSNWNNTVSIADYSCNSLVKPCVQYLGDGEYGVLYSGVFDPYGCVAYFDRTDMTAVEEVDEFQDFQAEAQNVLYTGSSIIMQLSLVSSSNVVITVYDIIGRQVKTLADEEFSAGVHSVQWDLRDYSGRKVCAGKYFINFQTNGSSITKTVHLF